MSVIDRMLEEWFEQKPWSHGMSNYWVEHCRDRMRATLSALNLTEAQAAALMDGSAVVVPVEEEEPEPTAEERMADWLRWHKAMLRVLLQPEETRG